MPLAKLDKLPCNANPTARPAPPRIATKEVVSIPNLAATLMSTSILIRMDNKEATKGMMLGFVLRRSSKFLNHWLSLLASQKPTSKVKMAMVILGRWIHAKERSFSTYISILVMIFCKSESAIST